MRQIPLDQTTKIIQELKPQIIGLKIYDQNEKEISPERISCITAQQDISISQANANMILKSIINQDLLPNTPKFIKKVNHPIFGATNNIKQVKKWKNTKKRPLEELLVDFPFADNIMKSRAIALMITPFININGVTPIGIYLGNRERIGKDYLAGLTRIMANDNAGELPPLKNDEETRKILFALVLDNEEFAHFSNNIGHMNSPSLEQAVTSKILKGRVLGKTEMQHAPFNIIVSLSGNAGWSLTPDLTYRSVIVVLHSDDEDILQRNFKQSPELLIEQNREEYWNTIKQMYNNWVKKGKPSGKINHATFPQWARIIGGIMEANSYVNPLTHTEAGTILSLVDRDGEEWKRFIPLLYNEISKHYLEGMSIKEIMQFAETNEYFDYFDFTKHGYKTAFGKIIKKYCDRWFGEYRIIKLGTELIGTNTGKQKYKVTKKGDE